MGRALAALLLLSACGESRGVTGPGGAATPPGSAEVDPSSFGGTTPAPRLVPAVCGAVAWTDVPIPALQADLAVASDGNNLAVLAAPRAGGTIVGFTVGPRMVGDATSTKLALDEPFSSVALGAAGERYFAAAVDRSAASPIAVIERLDPDLGQPFELAKVAGGIVAKPALVTAGRDAIFPVGGTDGVALAGFDDSWQALGTAHVATGEPVTGLTATRDAGDALVAWSTASTCSLVRVEGMAPGPVAQVGAACANPRLAADPTGGTEALVYTDGTDVLFKHFAGDQLGRGPELLHSHARAPRIAFDGTRYWVSYVDDHGDVVVGFLDSGEHLTSTALAGTQPQDDAYELVVLGGAPYVFALDGSGYSAHELCVVPES